MLAFLSATVGDPDRRVFMRSLYEENKWMLWSVVKRTCPDRNAWEDILRETLLRLLQKEDPLWRLDRAYIGPITSLLRPGTRPSPTSGPRPDDRPLRSLWGPLSVGGEVRPGGERCGAGPGAGL